MTVAIHQPNFIPWIGYFYKILKSECFVILDDVQYTKNSFINRNRIKTNTGLLWVTLPVLVSGKMGQKIIDCQIQNKAHSVSKILKTIEQNYRKSKYYEMYYKSMKKIFIESDDNLARLNISLITWIMGELNIHTKILRSSELSIASSSTQRLVDICIAVKGDIYLSGFGGSKYQDEDLFNENNIKLFTTTFKHPIYNQQWGDFLENASIIDLIFNEGPNAGNILNNCANG